MQVRAALFGLITFCLVSYSVSVEAQTVTATPDSAVVTRNADITPEKVNKPGLSKPARAALYSAILPGAGQFYNKDYWKVPVVYAVGGTLGYFIVSNHRNFKSYEQAYLYSIDNNPETVPGEVGNSNTLRNGRDFYRRNRDLTIIFSVLAYGLNVMEANVGAHLNEFDISDDLSLNVQPAVQFAATAKAPVPAISLNLRLKK